MDSIKYYSRLYIQFCKVGENGLLQQAAYSVLPGRAHGVLQQAGYSPAKYCTAVCSTTAGWIQSWQVGYMEYYNRLETAEPGRIAWSTTTG